MNIWSGLSCIFNSDAESQDWGMADPGPGQPGKALAQMVAEFMVMWKEQAGVSRRQEEELQDQTEHQKLIIEDLAAQIGSWRYQ